MSHPNPYEELLGTVNDKGASVADRLLALRSILRADPTIGRNLLVERASDSSEPQELLRELGTTLARLVWVGAASEFDLRDLTDAAAESFHQWLEPGRE